MSLSDRLQAAMRAADINQAELARKCGVKPPSIHGWLSGKSKFLRGENLLKAASTLGVSPKWLAEGVGPMRITDAPGGAEPPVSEVALPMESLSPEAVQLATEFDALKPAQKRIASAMLATYIKESTHAPKPFQYNKKTNVTPFSPLDQEAEGERATGTEENERPRVLRGMSGRMKSIGNVGPNKGAGNDKRNRNPRVPSKKHPRDA